VCTPGTRNRLLKLFADPAAGMPSPMEASGGGAKWSGVDLHTFRQVWAWVWICVHVRGHVHVAIVMDMCMYMCMYMCMCAE